MKAMSAGDGPKAACSRNRAACRFLVLLPGVPLPVTMPLPPPLPLPRPLPPPPAAWRVTVAVPDFVVSAMLVAVTVTVGLDGIAAGAEYTPVEVMVPAAADHVTMLLLAPVTVAVNVAVAESVTVAVLALTVTATGAVLTVMLMGVLLV